MANLKDRKIFGLRNFRGMDTENKPLKVAPFRAVDGKNFIIDSETLKTRPAFKYYDTPLKDLDDYTIIDFYAMNQDLFVYITNKGIVFKYKDIILSSLTNPNLYTNVFFEGKTWDNKPIFQEEKEGLFVFGMGGIYFISGLYDDVNELEHVILYELSNKMANPFHNTNSYYETFENFPIPYEPTLFIGSNMLDDVNLLSKVSKYKIFANSKNNSQENFNLYYLPTHYDENKHGDFPLVNISFYKDRYEGLEIFPVFLGIKDEDFGDEAFFGELEPEIIDIGETYFVKENFEYEMDNQEPPSYTGIKEIINLTKNEFFELKTTDGQKVFEFLLNYIEINFPNNIIPNPSDKNRILKFRMPIEKMVHYKDEDGKIVKINKEKEETYVYVQLKKFNLLGIELTEKNDLGSVGMFSIEDNSFPSYPTFVGDTYDEEHDITPGGVPIESSNFSIAQFRTLANTWFAQNKNNLTHDDLILLKARFKERKSFSNSNNSVSMQRYNDWISSDMIPGTNPPPYPSFSPGTNPVIEIMGTFSLGGQYVFKQDFETQVKSIIESNFLSGLPNDKTFGYVKFKFYKFWSDGKGTWYDAAQSVVAGFNYSKEYYYEEDRKGSYVMRAKVVINNLILIDDLLDFSFDKDMNSFIFKCKDYFYDFNNEPSIDIKITFKENPDYNIIANSKIGINFGSENRLFLAGNEEYPNIDRYNVSNDLLGDNIKKQSYELSYFPSRNYRVLGGRGAINGYVVASDTQLYITKEDYRNDSKLFIRNRTMNDNGIVGYNEFKTNIDKTPINEKVIVSFYNDILMLDKSGLYAIEMASNVLTNERLLKLRSGFINKLLIEKIEDNKVFDDSLFIYEDNQYMYIFIKNYVFVADSRYVAQNENSVIENVSYEIIKWETNLHFKTMRKINGKKLLLDYEGKSLYEIQEDNFDDESTYKKSYMAKSILENHDSSIFFANSIEQYLKDFKEISFSYHGVKTFKIVAKENIDYELEVLGVDSYKVNILNDFRFRMLNEGDEISFKNNFIIGDNVDYEKVEIESFNSTERESFIINDVSAFNLDLSKMYIDVSKKRLYPKVIFEKWENTNELYVILSPYKNNASYIKKEDFEDKPSYLDFISELDDDYGIYDFDTTLNILKDTLINKETKIRLEWVSPVLDFGYNFGEKTMFKTNLYGTKQDKENRIKFGYRTMRRFNRFDREGDSIMMKNTVSIKNEGQTIEVSNPMDFNEVDFNLFSINTFNEFGSSIHTKENNFLYIQFLILGEGNISLNSLEFLYKINRMLKTIG